MACSTIPSTSYYKPGGVAMVTANSSIGRIHKCGADALGCWCYQTLIGRNSQLVTIISAYQVCVSPSRRGAGSSLTAHSQQVSMLRMANRLLTPRQAFIIDLTAFIQSLQTQQHGILLIGNFNEPLDASLDNMTKLCSDCGLVDILYNKLGRDDFKTWQCMTDRQIDSALCSDWIGEALMTGCYKPFQFRTKGDHRNIVLDFDISWLFGNPTARLSTPAQRKFSSKDASCVSTYLRHKYKYLHEHNFFARLSAAQTQWYPVISEGLDRDFQWASSYAATKCRRKPNLVYACQIATLHQEKNVLRCLLSQSRTGESLQSSIARFTESGWSFSIPSTMEACQARCRILQRELRSLHRKAAMFRRDEQVASLRQADATGDRKRAKLLRRLIAAENTKAMYRKLRAFRQHDSAGVTKLKVPRDPGDTDYGSCTEWITVDAPVEIEQRLRERNQRHFGQAESSFPTVPPFSEWVNWTASTNAAELLLQGSCPLPAELDSLTADLLAHLKRRCPLDEINGSISINEWKEKIQAWPETTSTSPSGFHLTHNKALLARHNVDLTSPEGAEIERMREELISAQVALLNLALQHQYSYDRWKTVVNVMLLKEPGNQKIHQLRVVHLYEHDYNLLLAIKWRLLIQHYTQQQRLHPSQFGGIPGWDAVLPTVIKELQYEISRASRRPLDYDATAYYDCIVIPFSSLVARGFGQHWLVVYVHATMLQEAKYLFKTQLGISETFYRHCALFPIHGSGQGAGNSPGIRCCISSVLLLVFDKSVNGAQFSSPDSRITVQVFLIGFVDDTSCSVNDFLSPVPLPVSHYLTKAQQDTQWQVERCVVAVWRCP